MSKVQAFLINPIDQSVTEVEGDFADYLDIGKLIECDCFDRVRLNNVGDELYVDESGLINGKAAREGGFLYQAERRYVTLAGKGLILGCTSLGYAATPCITLDDVKRRINWLSPVHFGKEVLEELSRITVISFKH